MSLIHILSYSDLHLKQILETELAADKLLANIKKIERTTHFTTTENIVNLLAIEIFNKLSSRVKHDPAIQNLQQYHRFPAPLIRAYRSEIRVHIRNAIENLPETYHENIVASLVQATAYYSIKILANMEIGLSKCFYSAQNVQPFLSRFYQFYIGSPFHENRRQF
jgi:hypothetical protein